MNFPFAAMLLGSLRPFYRPLHYVIVDVLILFTRKLTFEANDSIHHIPIKQTATLIHRAWFIHITS